MIQKQKRPREISGLPLGSKKFVERAKGGWIGLKNADERNIPVLKQIKGDLHWRR